MLKQIIIAIAHQLTAAKAHLCHNRKIQAPVNIIQKAQIVCTTAHSALNTQPEMPIAHRHMYICIFQYSQHIILYHQLIKHYIQRVNSERYSANAIHV